MEKIWVNSYQEGVRAEINVKEFSSLHDVFNQSVIKFQNYPAFTNFGKSLTYSEVKKLVDAFSSFLQNELHLKKGDRIAIMLPNLLQYPIAIFAALQIGLVIVNVNPLYTPRELEHQLKDSGAETILIIENFAHTLEIALPNVTVKNIILASVGDLLGPLKGNLINFVLRKVKKQIPRFNLSHTISFNKALFLGGKKPFSPADVHLSDTAFLQYTGGTTGVPKGAILSHGNILANMLQAREWVAPTLDVTGGTEIIATPLPLYHIFSLTINMMLFVLLGGNNILITNPKDLKSVISTFKKYKITIFTAVNTLFNALNKQEDFKTVDFSSWKFCLGGGAAVQKAIADEWKVITGLPIIEAYGLTECSPGVILNPFHTKEFNGFIGLPISNTEVQIRDEEGKELGIGEMGDLWVKAPQVMQGYWNQPEETKKVLDENGWLSTGDVVVMDEKGFFKLVDRKKDLIIVSGFNVYPNEVEDYVVTHPDVVECACIGIPSEKTGEALKLFIVKSNPALTDKDIILYCRQGLTSYKVPRLIEFREELPKTNVGKILRKELRNEV